MSDFKPKPNTANLFYNDPGDNPKRPCYKTIGTVTFNGVEGVISGWKKTASNGNEYVSIVFESKDDYESKRGGSKPQSIINGIEQNDEDLPF